MENTNSQFGGSSSLQLWARSSQNIIVLVSPLVHQLSFTGYCQIEMAKLANVSNLPFPTSDSAITEVLLEYPMVNVKGFSNLFQPKLSLKGFHARFLLSQFQ